MALVTNYKGWRVQVHQMGCKEPSFLGAVCRNKGVPAWAADLYNDMQVSYGESLAGVLGELMDNIDDLNTVVDLPAITGWEQYE
jgi:hypothetical protein